jgi:hypothetical protein
MTMTYQNNGRVSAARRNGLLHYLNELLSSLGSWRTYEGVAGPGDLLKKLNQTSARFIGIDFLGEDGEIKLKSVLLAVMVVHALELLTGGAITFAARLFIRGKVLGQWRGIVIRDSPMSDKKARLLHLVSGGWVLPEAIGCYFFEGGRTWEVESFAVSGRGCIRAITRVGSLGIPRREFFFDRPVIIPAEDGQGLVGNNEAIGADGQKRGVPIQSVIEIVLGRVSPWGVPGFIGSVNDLENVVGGLGWAKRLLFMLSWFLIDEAERDVPLDGMVDYSTFNGFPQKPGLWGGSFGSKAGSAPPGGAVQLSLGSQFFGPAVSRPTSPPPPPPPVEDRPYQTINDRIQIGDKFYPVLITGIKSNPLNPSLKIPAAIFYDPAGKQWKEVFDPQILRWLAGEVQAGRMSVCSNWRYLI